MAGGNPYYLLQRVRETGADAIIEEIVEAGRPIIGSSAGALLLGRSLNVVPIFDASVPDLGCKDTDALRLIPFTVLPHTNRWKARFADYAARVAAAAVLCRSEILEIADDEGLLIDGDTLTRIGGRFLSSPIHLSAQPTA